MRKSTETVKRVIKIDDVIDCNGEEYLQEVGKTKEKTVGCLCCVAGTLDVTGKFFAKSGKLEPSLLARFFIILMALIKGL